MKTNHLYTDIDELVTLLTSCGLFKAALHLCSTFTKCLVSVFVGLTWRCVMLSEEEDPNAWNWLVENDLQGTIVLLNEKFTLNLLLTH